LRAPRANRGFGTDEMRIRTKTTVIDEINGVLALLLSGIADRVSTDFRPPNIKTVHRPAAI
jgi:hypothetical protein